MEKVNDIFDKEYDDSSSRTDGRASSEEEEYGYGLEIEEEEKYGSSKPFRSTIRARIVI